MTPIKNTKKSTATSSKRNPNGVLKLLHPYFPLLLVLLGLAIFSNGLSLLLPKLVAHAIDSFAAHQLEMSQLITPFLAVVMTIFVSLYLQSVVQTYLSEKVALDMRNQLAAKISRQDYAFVQATSPAKLLTNLTSDIDSVKQFVAQAIVSLVSSLFLVIGASVLLLLINWKLALLVLSVLPIIVITFVILFSQMGGLFRKGQEALDWLNKVINESIIGAPLIRILNSEASESRKFLAANRDAQKVGLHILQLFASLIPIVTFISSMATLLILTVGGRFVIYGNMSLGNFAAFNSYIAILIFPLVMIGFMSNVIGRAMASYGRVSKVLTVPEQQADGELVANLSGATELKSITLEFGDTPILKNISFEVKPHTKLAIIGPTAAGKTQLLYLLAGLTNPSSGDIFYDGKSIRSYNQESLHQQIGFVFQDSIIFNLSLRENIAFSTVVKDEDLAKAIQTAELTDFVATLPEKLDTIVSERGADLSGGQKQRIMLARALALNPKILLLDDFTARVDPQTEQKILKNIAQNYPDLTLISVTQKIAAVEHYDQIMLLMEGELLAKGTHQQLLEESPEYVQIFSSQKSTNRYEV